MLDGKLNEHMDDAHDAQMGKQTSFESKREKFQMPFGVLRK